MNNDYKDLSLRISSEWIIEKSNFLLEYMLYYFDLSFSNPRITDENELLEKHIYFFVLNFRFSSHQLISYLLFQ